VRALPLLATLLPMTGCQSWRDITLVLRGVTEARNVADPWLTQKAEVLDCSGSNVRLAAVCTESYTLSADGKITMRAACDEASGVPVGDDQALLKAYLRGLQPLAEGFATDSANKNYLRLLGYRDAGRTDAEMCGITPAFPQHLEGDAGDELALYLLCRPAADLAGLAVFQDYCSTAGFLTLFP
jgi:hypothetical protein